MVKRYFAAKRTYDTRLIRILVIIVVVLGAAYSVMWAGAWFFSAKFGGSVRASAPENLEKARTLAEEGEAAGARALLEPIVGRVTDPAIAPKALLLLAELEFNAGNREKARELLKQATEKYPASPDYPAAATRYARLLEDAGEIPKALEVYQKICSDAAPGQRSGALAGLGRDEERRHDLLAAREKYREAVADAPRDTPEWNEAVDALGRINVALIFSPLESPESKYYLVERGDNFTTIGIKLNTTLGLLTRANGLEESARLQLGQRLKYTPKDFHIIIERSTCRLFLMDKDGLFKRYFVGLGMPGHETALGEYTIGNKQKDPTWFKPGAGPVPPGDPANELGTRWMPLVPAEEGLPTDLGIHGTIAPETVGKYASHGCPRLTMADVEELYDLVVRSTPVKIVEIVDWAATGK